MGETSVAGINRDNTDPRARASFQADLEELAVPERKKLATEDGIVHAAITPAEGSQSRNASLINLIVEDSAWLGPSRRSWGKSLKSSTGFGEGVQYTNRMLLGLADSGWRRIVYTVHLLGCDVHCFSVGKEKRCAEWSKEFISRLIDMIEDDL